MKRAHGKHNKDICDKLYLQDELECNDWVITTAFYSSIHYLDHILFPYLHTDGCVFNDINEAHKIIKAKNKHETRGILVQRKVPSLGGHYVFLKEECYNARYSNYQVNEAFSNRAVRNLEKIICESDKMFETAEKAKK